MFRGLRPSELVQIEWCALVVDAQRLQTLGALPDFTGVAARVPYPVPVPVGTTSVHG